MPKPISELRASGHVRQPIVQHTICLNVDLAEEYRALQEQMFKAAEELEAVVAAEAKKPQRLGSKGPAVSAKVKAARKKVSDQGVQLDAIAERMAEFEVEVTLQRSTGGEWNTWAADHPPREQEPDESGRRALIMRDAQHGGRCDFDALVAELPNWVTVLNGEPATAENWEWLAGTAGPQDLDDLADAVMTLHGSRVRPPKPVATSLSTLLDAFDSSSPEPGE